MAKSTEEVTKFFTPERLAEIEKKGDELINHQRQADKIKDLVNQLNNEITTAVGVMGLKVEFQVIDHFKTGLGVHCPVVFTDISIEKKL